MSDDKKPAEAAASNFIREIIDQDLATGKYQGRVATRFPPEPNGYLHIGHAKSICLNFGLAGSYGGSCNLRFDDTNPTKEEVEFVESIKADVRWLGFEWSGLYFASDYFEQLYQIAERLIEQGKAYVDSATEDEIREARGNYYKKGVPTRDRDRPVAESLDLFRRMRKGEFKDGAYVLRAKIDLETQNMNLRDPVLYRIRHAHHHRTGDQWCIYPMYDYAHPLSDAIEKITHSVCTLEFESHRPLYDWCIREAGVFPSQQIEFAKLKLTHTLMSKRNLLQMVQQGIVSGWDDPRMPTLAAMRRRGFTPEAIRAFAERVGVAKADSVVDLGLLEYHLREDLNRRCPRLMAVLRPLKLVIENFPEGEVRELDAPLFPEDASQGSRKVPFSRVLYIERDDFREEPPKDWFRLAPGREVRLRYACLVKCTEVVKDAQGEITELRCTWDPASWGGTSPDGRVVRGTLHWVSAAHAASAEVRLYDRLFNVESPGTTEGRSFVEELNPNSLEKLPDAKVEPWLGGAAVGTRVQFERLGYFCVDPDSTDGKRVWNRTVTLKDTWAKIEAKATAKKPAKEPAKAVPAPVPVPVPVSVPASAVAPLPIAPEITIDDFAKLDLRVGVVRSAELIPDAKKLLKLGVDLGEGRVRQIFAGLRAYYPDPAALVGQQVIVVANLKPRQMKWGLSEGMILAAGGPDGDPRPHRVLTASDTQPGDKVR
jgi:glutaminyl-tRNA synthetase